MVPVEVVRSPPPGVQGSRWARRPSTLTALPPVHSISISGVSPLPNTGGGPVPLCPRPLISSTHGWLRESLGAAEQLDAEAPLRTVTWRNRMGQGANIGIPSRGLTAMAMGAVPVALEAQRFRQFGKRATQSRRQPAS